MANFGDIGSSLTIGAGKSVRRNAGDSAFEAFSPVFVPLAQYYSDVNGNVSGAVDAFSTTVAAGTLTANGDAVRAVYAGTAPTANAVSVDLQFAGTTIFASGDVAGAADWRIETAIVRTGSTTARAVTTFHFGATSAVDYAEVTSGLDFATSETLTLRLGVEDAGTDITAKLGLVWKQAA